MFQDLLHTITTFIMIAVVTVTGVLHRPTFTPNKPVDTPTATPSAVVSESATPPASPTLTPSITSKPHPISVQKAIEPIPTIIPYTAPQNPIQYPQTYRTLTLAELGTLPTNNQPLMDTIQSAYNEFLRTPNLSYLTPQQQSQLFERMVTTYIQRLVDQQIDQQKMDLQEKIIQKQQELNQLNSIPIPSSNNAYQTCLDNKIATINSNPYLSESSRLSQIERAKYDCAN